MADHLERIGQTVGDYRLVRWLGGGGFGNVYLADHTHDSEQAALKVLEIRLTKSEDFPTGYATSCKQASSKTEKRLLLKK